MPEPLIELHLEAPPLFYARGDRNHLFLLADSSLPADHPDYAPVAAFVAEHGMLAWEYKNYPPGELAGIDGAGVRVWFMAPHIARRWAAGVDDAEVGFTLLDYFPE
ncbi:hypothetical protein ABQF34_07210 [Mycolicibacterium boenickei]